MEQADPEGKFHVAAVALGSNMGDRQAFLSLGVRHLRQPEGNRLLEASSVYETEPFGNPSQDWFLNAVVQMETRMDMKPFFRLLQAVEDRLGRKRLERWGPRTLDLDLLLFDDAVFSDEDLVVPHPGIAERRFVLEPLSEIAPGLTHPLSGRTIRELLERCEDRCKVIRHGRIPCLG